MAKTETAEPKWTSQDERDWASAQQIYSNLERRRNDARAKDRDALVCECREVLRKYENLPDRDAHDLADVMTDKAHELRVVLEPYDKGPPPKGEAVEVAE